MYRSRLKIIAPHKKEKKTINRVWLKIKEKAKKEEIIARTAVKKTVKPIQIYLVVSNLGHFSNSSILAPEQKIKNLLMNPIL